MKSFVFVVAGGLSGMAHAAAVDTNPTPPVPSPTQPCAVVSAAYAKQMAVSPSAAPTIAAAIAHECLLSVPLGKQAAIELVDSIEPYLEWQSDSAYLANPPKDYFYPAYDMFANLAAIRKRLESDGYSGEYEFQQDLYNTVFAPAHDGHFVFYPDLLSRVFDWNRPFALVSISDNQSSLPEIKTYRDVVASPSTASTVTLINGIDAATFLEDTINLAGWSQDVDSNYNSMFYQMSSVAAGLGVGYFRSGGRIRFVYQGDTTNLTFANGTEITLENFARIKVPMTGITDGESMYKTFCNPNGYPKAAATNSTTTNSTAVKSMPDYPTPVVITKDAVVGGYFLEGEGYEDVAVIVLLSFESDSMTEFQSVVSRFLAEAVAAGKTKLVVDFQGNGGGLILQGHDFFRQLFPSVQEDGFGRWKASDSFLAISHVVSDAVAGLDPYTSPEDDLIYLSGSRFNYRFDLNATLGRFPSFDDKFGPVVFQDTNYTEIMRWDLNDNLTTTNETYGIGMEISGYGGRANLTQPFAAENIVMLYDGVCASTCTIASEMLRIQAGVRSVAMGGRPREGPIQGVGGVKGSEVLTWGNVLFWHETALDYADVAAPLGPAQAAALARYGELPINRSTSAAVNGRDQILRGNLGDGLPAQFVVEHADCRLYWTAPMVTDITAVWKAAADSAWNGAACADGNITPYSPPADSSPYEPPAPQRRDAGHVARGPAARPVEQRPASISRRGRSRHLDYKAKQVLKAIP